MVVIWASVATLLSLQDILDATLKSIDKEAWKRIRSAAFRIRFNLGLNRKSQRFDVSQLSEGISARIATVFAWRASGTTITEMARKFRAIAMNEERMLGDSIIVDALDAKRFGLKTWKPDLPTIRECYEAGYLGRTAPLRSPGRLRRGFQWPLLAGILNEPYRYPTVLISAAEEAYRLATAAKMKPVAQVASEDGWFEC
jgi:hypothetical protein